ncbi:uncharacterized protein LOC117182143 [Belonocnema kinseyi]|uniref:uncharacterized protein LOC117182143 n=1 Tax=Belonocnema kinseyi TaxID=2817044 RepID=UPI00143DD3A7|nr:uncharacterized protein LOC117182143 [Belonocnema kinseyi]
MDQDRGGGVLDDFENDVVPDSCADTEDSDPDSQVEEIGCVSPRKRIRKPHTYKRNFAKVAVETGSERKTTRGRVIPEKSFCAQGNWKCKKKYILSSTTLNAKEKSTLLIMKTLIGPKKL